MALMVPPDTFSMSSAHALVAGTSGWAGGSQIEIFRSTGLSGAIADEPSRPIASATASFFMAVPPKLFVTPNAASLAFQGFPRSHLPYVPVSFLSLTRPPFHLCYRRYDVATAEP